MSHLESRRQFVSTFPRRSLCLALYPPLPPSLPLLLSSSPPLLLSSSSSSPPPLSLSLPVAASRPCADPAATTQVTLDNAHVDLPAPPRSLTTGCHPSWRSSLVRASPETGRNSTRHRRATARPSAERGDRMSRRVP